MNLNIVTWGNKHSETIIKPVVIKQVLDIEGVKVFIAKDTLGKGWSVSEYNTGFGLRGGTTIKDAVQHTREYLCSMAEEHGITVQELINHNIQGKAVVNF